MSAQRINLPAPTLIAPVAYTGAVLFVALFVTYGIAPTSPAVSLLGVAVHMLLFPVVAALPAPSWAKAGGYGWMVVDIVSNVMSLSGITTEMASSVRFGGHVVAVLWIATASLGADRVTKAVGLLLSLILFVTAVGNQWLPPWLFAFAMPLLPIWLVLVGRALSREADREYSQVAISGNLQRGSAATLSEAKDLLERGVVDAS